MIYFVDELSAHPVRLRVDVCYSFSRCECVICISNIIFTPIKPKAECMHVYIYFIFICVFLSPVKPTKPRQPFTRICRFDHTNQPNTTFSNGYLGSRNDEERSEMRYVMRIAEFSESSKFWTHIALPGYAWEHACLSACCPHSPCFGFCRVSIELVPRVYGGRLGCPSSYCMNSIIMCCVAWSEETH